MGVANGVNFAAPKSLEPSILEEMKEHMKINT